MKWKGLFLFGYFFIINIPFVRVSLQSISYLQNTVSLLLFCADVSPLSAPQLFVYTFLFFFFLRQGSATVLMVYEFAYHVFFWQAIYAVAFRQIKWDVRVCIKELKMLPRSRRDEGEDYPKALYPGTSYNGGAFISQSVHFANRKTAKSQK